MLTWADVMWRYSEQRNWLAERAHLFWVAGACVEQHMLQEVRKTGKLRRIAEAAHANLHPKDRTLRKWPVGVFLIGCGVGGAGTGRHEGVREAKIKSHV